MRNRGFTLIELIIVILILGIVTLSLIPMVWSMQERLAVNNAVQEVKIALDDIKTQAFAGNMNISSEGTTTQFLLFAAGKKGFYTLEVPITRNGLPPSARSFSVRQDKDDYLIEEQLSGSAPIVHTPTFVPFADDVQLAEIVNQQGMGAPYQLLYTPPFQRVYGLLDPAIELHKEFTIKLFLESHNKRAVKFIEINSLYGTHTVQKPKNQQ